MPTPVFRSVHIHWTQHCYIGTVE